MASTRKESRVQFTSNVFDTSFDCAVLITNDIQLKHAQLQPLRTILEENAKVDESISNTVSFHVSTAIPSKRLVFSPTGPLNRDYDDVRRFYDAAEAGIKRAVSAGCKKPLLIVPSCEKYKHAMRAALMGALSAAYVPLDIREFAPEKACKCEVVGIWGENAEQASLEAEIAFALESGRYVCRDIGGSDPERMAAPAAAAYVEDVFKGTSIKVKVISDIGVLKKEYPLLAAVNRAAKGIQRHEARVIELEYNGEGPIDQTLMLVGKGITYDTGGADIKVGGSMGGMHRDKCGAAFVAGFFKVLDKYQPKGLRVLGTMAMVRNSVGNNSYVADEIIIGRSGKRVRIGNTDAEGRMVMSDPLCQMKERALKEVNPQLFTIATLTGHVIRAYSEHYGAVMCNGPARNAKIDAKIFDAGEETGDPFEISTIRREDYKQHGPKTESEDVWQSGGGPSTMTPRGHQSPSAFLIMASGLDKHGLDSNQQLAYTHLDIAGCSGPWPGVPTGSPVVAMSQAYILPRQSGKS